MGQPTFDFLTEEQSDRYFDWTKILAEESRDQSEAQNATQPFSIPRGEDTKYLREIKTYVRELQAGVFLKKHKFSEDSTRGANLRAIGCLAGCTEVVVWKSIRTAVNAYLCARNNPDRYEFMSRERRITLAEFIYENNEHSGARGVSHFMKFYLTPLKVRVKYEGPERMLAAIYPKDLPIMYAAVYNNYRDFDDTEYTRMIKSMLSLCRWYKQHSDNLMKIYGGQMQCRFPYGMVDFLEHYLGRFVEDNRFVHPIGLFPGNDRWQQFADFMFDETGIDLDKKEKEAVPSFRKDSISDEEIRRRMDAD